MSNKKNEKPLDIILSVSKGVSLFIKYKLETNNKRGLK